MVLLPAPLGPSSTVTAAPGAVKVTSSTTRRLPSTTVRPDTMRPASGVASDIGEPPLAARQEHQEEGRADDAGDHAEGDLGPRGHETRDDVTREHEHPAGQRGRGDQAAVIDA